MAKEFSVSLGLPHFCSHQQRRGLRGLRGPRCCCCCYSWNTQLSDSVEAGSSSQGSSLNVGFHKARAPMTLLRLLISPFGLPPYFLLALVSNSPLALSSPQVSLRPTHTQSGGWRPPGGPEKRSVLGEQPWTQTTEK